MAKLNDSTEVIWTAIIKNFTVLASLAAIVYLVIAILNKYQTAQDTISVLGAVLPSITAVVGAVFGVSIGTSIGKEAGKQEGKASEKRKVREEVAGIEPYLAALKQEQAEPGTVRENAASIQTALNKLML